MFNQFNPGFDPQKRFKEIRDTVRDSVGRLLEDGISLATGAQLLPVDVYETETSVVVKAGPLLGIQPEAIDVSLVGDTLTIKGETSPDEEVGQETYLRRERSYGTFTRSVTIPPPLDAHQPLPTSKDCTLPITLP